MGGGSMFNGQYGDQNFSKSLQVMFHTCLYWANKVFTENHSMDGCSILTSIFVNIDLGSKSQCIYLLIFF